MPTEDDDATTTPEEASPDTPTKPDKADTESYYRRKHDAAQRELAALKREKMSEAARIQAERDDARKEAQELRDKVTATERHQRLTQEARRLGITNPERGAKLLAAEISWGEDGQPFGLKDAAASLKQDFPGIFAAVPGPRAGGGGNVRGGAFDPKTASISAMDARIRADLAG